VTVAVATLSFMGNNLPYGHDQLCAVIGSNLRQPFTTELRVQHCAHVQTTPNKHRREIQLLKLCREQWITPYVRDTSISHRWGGAAGASLTCKEQYLYGSSHRSTTISGEYPRQYAEATNSTPYSAPKNLRYPEYFAFGPGIERGAAAVLGGIYRYKYNGKELNEDLGLYDYGARWYDPAIARWTTIDPLASDYAPFSPYNYVLNNPINSIDPDGMRVKALDDDTQSYILGYLNDQFGEGHGFSFNKKRTSQA